MAEQLTSNERHFRAPCPVLMSRGIAPEVAHAKAQSCCFGSHPFLVSQAAKFKLTLVRKHLDSS